MKRRKTSDGYYEIYVPDHPMSKQRSGWLLEHRYIMSKHLGRTLSSNEIIHHKDENKLNNKLSNLELTNPKTHGKKHFGTNSHKECLHCRKTFHIKPSELKRGKGKFCSTKCVGLAKTSKIKPSKEQLIKDINNLPYTKIGIKYNVSDNAVRKWAKKYSLI